MARPQLLFVTGKLAEAALRRTLAEIAGPAGFDYQVAVLPITVAALTTTPWVARHLSVPPGVERVILPGLCGGDPAEVAAAAGVPVERGPTDLRDLPDFFQADKPKSDYGAFDIAILAEINYAPRLDPEELLRQALAARAAGAGCGGRALPHRPDPGAGRLRVRRGAGPLPGGAPPLPRRGNADGRRQPDGTDRRGLGGRQRDAAWLRSGGGRAQCADHGGHQLVPQLRARAGPGPAAGALRLSAARAAE